MSTNFLDLYLTYLGYNLYSVAAIGFQTLIILAPEPNHLLSATYWYNVRFYEDLAWGCWSTLTYISPTFCGGQWFPNSHSCWPREWPTLFQSHHMFLGSLNGTNYDLSHLWHGTLMLPMKTLFGIAHKLYWPIFVLGYDPLSVSRIGFRTFPSEWNWLLETGWDQITNREGDIASGNYFFQLIFLNGYSNSLPYKVVQYRIFKYPWPLTLVMGPWHWNNFPCQIVLFHLKVVQG